MNPKQSLLSMYKCHNISVHHELFMLFTSKITNVKNKQTYLYQFFLYESKTIITIYV